MKSILPYRQKRLLISHLRIFFSPMRVNYGYHCIFGKEPDVCLKQSISVLPRPAHRFRKWRILLDQLPTSSADAVLSRKLHAAVHFWVVYPMRCGQFLKSKLWNIWIFSSKVLNNYKTQPPTAGRLRRTLQKLLDGILEQSLCCYSRVGCRCSLSTKRFNASLPLR